MPQLNVINPPFATAVRRALSVQWVTTDVTARASATGRAIADEKSVITIAALHKPKKMIGFNVPTPGLFE
jgi:hypothetical protein